VENQKRTRWVKKMNGKTLEIEREDNGFSDINAQAVRAAIIQWEKRRGLYIEKLHNDFLFGNPSRRRRRKAK
jgi:hypothetical protein